MFRSVNLVLDYEQDPEIWTFHHDIQAAYRYASFATDAPFSFAKWLLEPKRGDGKALPGAKMEEGVQKQMTLSMSPAWIEKVGDKRGVA